MGGYPNADTMTTGGMAVLKKIVPWAILIVVLFYIVRNPVGAAATGRHIGSDLASAADWLGRLVTSMVTHK